MNALVDLIRHGKHHHHHQARNDETPAPVQRTPAQHEQQNKAAEKRHIEKENPEVAHREAAQIIVQEEREARAQMPTYKGLENFQLIEKMGESVKNFAGLKHHAHVSCSGAFSNVYKAVDLTTQKSVAGMYSVSS